MDYVLVGTFHGRQDFCTDSDCFEWLIGAVFVCVFEAAGRDRLQQTLKS